jgi:hypothetical protein
VSRKGIASSILYSKSDRCLTSKPTPTHLTEEEPWKRVNRGEER